MNQEINRWAKAWNHDHHYWIYRPDWLFYYTMDRAGHAPVSNLFEFTTFFGMMLVGAFILFILFIKHLCLGFLPYR